MHSNSSVSNVIQSHIIDDIDIYSLLYHSVRIALNVDHVRSEISKALSENARRVCMASAQDITHILRWYRSHYGLRHSPLIMVYAIVQGTQILSLLGTQAETQYLAKTLDECCIA